MDSELSPPQLVATTGGTYSCSIEESRQRELEAREGSHATPSPITAQDSYESNYFKSIQWSEILFYSALLGVHANSDPGLLMAHR